MMGAVLRTAVGGLRRRRLQAFVIFSVLALASGSGMLALAVMVESHAPFERAFAAANGADLVVEYDASVGAAALAATAQAAPVTEAAGPWPVGWAGAVTRAAETNGSVAAMPGIRVSGRSNPDTAVDRIAVSSGRWWQASGEIVASDAFAQRLGIAVGDTIDLAPAQLPSKGQGPSSGGAQVTPGAGPAALTAPPRQAPRPFRVVGIAGSVSTPGVDGWLSPADLLTLTPAPATTSEMLYRVSRPDTAGDLGSALAAITAGLDPSTVEASTTWLALREQVNRIADIFVPVLLGFSLLSLLAGAFLVANTASGIVLAGYREIGIQKAVGFGPRQVVAVLLAEVLGPAALGSALGVAVGALGSVPVVEDTVRAFGLPVVIESAVPVAVGVLAAALGIASLAVVAPAARASRLRAVEALGRGASPSRGAGGALHRRVLAAGLPPAVRVGLANVAARPGRAAMTLGALVVGVAAVVLALSLTASLSLVATDLLRDRTAPVRVQLQDETAAARVTAAISSDPATARYTSVAQLEVTVPQLGRIPLVAYREDAGWAGYQLISGRWFAGPDEVVAPTNVFRSGGFRLGDTLQLGVGGRSVRVTLVGEVFDEAREGTDELVLRGGWPVLTALQPDAAPTRWEVLPVTGTPAGAYRSALSDELGQAASVDVVTDSASDADFVLFNRVIGILGAVLVLASLGGVFTTVMLETRQRTRQTAILKVIGMGPRQVAAMVLASVVPVGLAAGLLGVPAGLAGQRLILGQMGEVALKTAIPASVLDVLAWPVLAGLLLSGTLIGIIGALVPATRAARAAVAPVLQAE